MKHFLLALLLTVAVGFAFAEPAQATNNGNGPCPGHFFCGEQGPKGDKGDRGPRGYTGATGRTGATGEDGKDGYNGYDGVDGINGLAGLNGVDGQDVDPLAMADMYDEMSTQNNLNLALDSIRILLPQKNSHRLTLNRSMQHGGEQGNGIGYAYMFDGDSRTAVFAGWGESNGQHATEIGISFEF